MASASSIDLSYKQEPDNGDLSHIPGEDGLPVVGVMIPLVRDFQGFIAKQYET